MLGSSGSTCLELLGPGHRHHEPQLRHCSAHGLRLVFLGVGVQPPTPEWGAIIAEGRQYIRVAPYITTITGVFIFLTVLGFNLLGDGLRDALDPRAQRR